jgi:hypothetical protein
MTDILDALKQYDQPIRKQVKRAPSRRVFPFKRRLPKPQPPAQTENKEGSFLLRYPEAAAKLLDY